MHVDCAVGAGRGTGAALIESDGCSEAVRELAQFASLR